MNDPNGFSFYQGECPDFFPLDGKQVLMTSPQDMTPVGLEFHAGNGTLCLIGDYDPQGKGFVRQHIQAIDYGIDFYAAQTLFASDGRRIMVAWMQNWDTTGAKPHHCRWFRIRVAKDGEHETIIRYRPSNGTLKIDRTRSGLPRDIVHTRSFLVRPQDGAIKLRVILDRFSVEVFVNDGEQAATTVIYTRQSADAITFEAGGSVLVDVEKYDLVFDGPEMET